MVRSYCSDVRARHRAGFSWWGAWGPAIGVGDGRGALPCPPPPPHTHTDPGKYFSVKHRPNVKFGHFRTNVVCRIQEFCYFGGKYDVKFQILCLYIISGKNVLPPAKVK